MITDPTVVGFCNEDVRAVADRFAQLYYWSLSLRDEWVKRNYGESIPNDPGEIVDDGADLDSRPVIAGSNVHDIAAAVVDYITDFEANNKELLGKILAVAVNPMR